MRDVRGGMRADVARIPPLSNVLGWDVGLESRVGAVLDGEFSDRA
jgi:hypothetical protein